MVPDVIPRHIACRVDVDHSIWVLVEYVGADDQWHRFKNEHELEDFVSAFSGAPLQIPPKRLSAEESVQLVSHITDNAINVIHGDVCCRNRIVKRK